MEAEPSAKSLSCARNLASFPPCNRWYRWKTIRGDGSEIDHILSMESKWKRFFPQIRGDATLCGLGIMMNNEMDINHLFRLIFANFCVAHIWFVKQAKKVMIAGHRTSAKFGRLMMFVHYPLISSGLLVETCLGNCCTNFRYQFQGKGLFCHQFQG